jgi:ribonuclease J
VVEYRQKGTSRTRGIATTDNNNPYITIHRGTHRIGGVVTEISDGTSKVFIDIGENLPDADLDAAELPPIEGLTTGDCGNSALFLTHYHGDHIGNLRLVRPGIPVYMGKTAKALHLGLAERVRKDEAALFRSVNTFEPLNRIQTGGITVTPLMTDHSAFDAYMFVIEAGGKRILHTGDFRTHGFRGGKTFTMLRAYAKDIDYIISEGTMLSRKGEKVMTEAELRGEAVKIMRGAKYTFALASSMNIDRIGAFYHAARKAGRLFVCDYYQRDQLEIVRERHMDKTSLYDFSGIYAVASIDKTTKKLLRYMEDKGFCMMIRASDKFKPYLDRFADGRAVVYSMWSGYLKGRTANENTVRFLKPYEYVQLHTSGHATTEALRKLCDTVRPKCGIIPMHTDSPKALRDVVPGGNIILLKDGEKFEIGDNEMKLKYDYQAVIDSARKLLNESPEWIEHYAGYADALVANGSFIRSARRMFHSWAPLRYYVSMLQAKGAKRTLMLDIRYMGQNVACLKARKDGSVVVSTKGLDEANKLYFGCDIVLDNAEWKGADARKFRAFFKALPPRAGKGKKHNEEHNVESILITEFSKTRAAEKKLIGIQPVRIGGVRFGMPTPVSASNHSALKYSGAYGGGMDIFARSGKPPRSYLTVIEVKDENVKGEPPQDALKQAIEYAVFLRELLRSGSGAMWWRLFGYRRALPEKLTIRCACAMPDDIPDKSFAGRTFNIDGDVIECHYIYFQMAGGVIKSIDSSMDCTKINGSNGGE